MNLWKLISDQWFHATYVLSYVAAKLIINYSILYNMTRQHKAYVVSLTIPKIRGWPHLWVPQSRISEVADRGVFASFSLYWRAISIQQCYWISRHLFCSNFTRGLLRYLIATRRADARVSSYYAPRQAFIFLALFSLEVSLSLHPRSGLVTLISKQVFIYRDPRGGLHVDPTYVAQGGFLRESCRSKLYVLLLSRCYPLEWSLPRLSISHDLTSCLPLFAWGEHSRCLVIVILSS